MQKGSRGKPRASNGGKALVGAGVGAAAGAVTNAVVGNVGIAACGTAVGLGLLSMTGIGAIAGLLLAAAASSSGESRD